jgi:pyruvate dehydrogenase E2 component (dihydrolipoamide acetyltransferase)
MAVAVQLPALSPTMKEGRITKWLKNEGDKISSGSEIAECETDKSNLAIEAYDDGVLLKILVKAGDSAPVGSTIAWIGKPGEKVPEAPASTISATAAGAAATAAVAAPQTAPVSTSSAPVVIAKTAATPVFSNPAPNGRLRASPLAKKVAAAQGLDLSMIQGSGPNGRIVRRDVEAAQKTQGSKTNVFVRSSGGLRPPPSVLPVTQMRRVIAQRLSEVKPGVPHFYLTVELEMDQALKLREQAKANELKLSVNDIIVKAVAVAVRRFPRINQVFAGETIQQLHAVDVGVAVAIEDGLITPIVKDADQKGLAEIATEIRDLADRAKRKALKPEEYAGGSITVSNLGMFGIDSFIAVINPPQASILAVGKVEPKVVVRDNQMVIRQMMSMTFSGDHRVVDGAVGAQFLQIVRELLEQPMRLLF